MRFEDLTTGLRADQTKTITDADIAAFATVVGDFNPVHMDEEFAAQTRFKGRIAHGMLVASLFSGVLAHKLPGPGAIYLAQSLRFTKPVRIGDTVTATVEVAEIHESRRRVRLMTTCRNQDGEVVVDGEATVMVPEG